MPKWLTLFIRIECICIASVASAETASNASIWICSACAKLFHLTCRRAAACTTMATIPSATNISSRLWRRRLKGMEWNCHPCEHCAHWLSRLSMRIAHAQHHDQRWCGTYSVACWVDDEVRDDAYSTATHNFFSETVDIIKRVQSSFPLNFSYQK